MTATQSRTRTRSRTPRRPPTRKQPDTPPELTKPGSSAYGTGQADGTNDGPRPFLITPEQSVELALINSREFQDVREELYLVALPVTLERFAFAAQFFATGEIFREVTGSKTPDGQHNRWRFNNDGGFSKLFSTGALLLLRFANRTVVELTGDHPRHTTSFSTINAGALVAWVGPVPASVFVAAGFVGAAVAATGLRFERDADAHGGVADRSARFRLADAPQVLRRYPGAVLIMAAFVAQVFVRGLLIR